MPPYETALASAAGNGTVVIWNFLTIKTYAWYSLYLQVTEPVFSPDETAVASAAADETIRIWNCFTVDKSKIFCI